MRAWQEEECWNWFRVRVKLISLIAPETPEDVDATFSLKHPSH